MGDLWKSVLAQNGPDFFENFTAYEYIEFLSGHDHPGYTGKNRKCSGSAIIIRTFIYHEGIEEEPLGEHLDELEPLRAMYHKLYEQAKVDHSIRTDLSEQELFTTVAIAMLAVAERYAQGIVWDRMIIKRTIPRS